MRLANDIAVFGWIIVGAWWAGLLAATWLVLRDGPPEGLSASWTAVGLGFFWLGGIGVAHWAFRQPRLAVEVRPDGTVRIEERFALRRRALRLGAADVARVEVAEETDSDGDPYFRCWLVLRDGRRFAAAEGHRRDAVEAKARGLRGALGAG